MSSLRTRLLTRVAAARAKSGPDLADIRQTLTIRTRTWSGEYVGDGTYTDSDLVLPPHYPIRFMKGEDVTASGGEYQLDDLIVNHITPADGNGNGYVPEQLDPTIHATNVEVFYVISGDWGETGDYTLLHGRFNRPFSYSLVLRRRLPQGSTS